MNIGNTDPDAAPTNFQKFVSKTDPPPFVHNFVPTYSSVCIIPFYLLYLYIPKRKQKCKNSTSAVTAKADLVPDLDPDVSESA